MCLLVPHKIVPFFQMLMIADHIPNNMSVEITSLCSSVFINGFQTLNTTHGKYEMRFMEEEMWFDGSN